MRLKGEIRVTPLLAWRLELAGLRLSWLWIMLALVVVLVLVGEDSPFLVRAARAVGYLAAAVGVVAVFVGALAWPRWRRSVGASQHVELNEQRVVLQTGKTTTTQPWAQVLDVRRTQVAWVLETAARPVMVPRGAFSHEEAATVDAWLVTRAEKRKADALRTAQEARDARLARRRARRQKRPTKG